MQIRELLRKRKKDTHKGDYGHVYILGGSRGLTGAACLCSMASLRSGAGLVTLGIPFSLNIAMEAKLTEVMTHPLPETIDGALSLKAKKAILNKINGADAIVLGPGLSCNPETVKLVRNLILDIQKRLVIDADALNAISRNTSILKKLKCEYIITPHPGEMARLIKKGADFITKNKEIVAKRFASEYNAVVVLKGSRTVVSEKKSRGQVYINKSGNPGMATAGSGDVLTGVIAGFLAQGLKTVDAARLAVYVHGMAGDLAAKEKGEIGLIAGDILDKIPEAIEKLV